MKLFSSDKRKKLFDDKGNFVMKSILVEIAKEVNKLASLVDAIAIRNLKTLPTH